MPEPDLIRQQRSLLRDFRQAEAERAQAEAAAEARRLADRAAVDSVMRQRCQTAIGQLAKAREAHERGLSALRRAGLEQLVEKADYEPSFVAAETDPVSALERAAFGAVSSANGIEADIAALQHWQAARARRIRWIAAVSGVLLVVLTVTGFLGYRAWQIELLRRSAQKTLERVQIEGAASILVELNKMAPSDPILVEMPASHPDLRAPLIRSYGELWQNGEVFLVRTLGGHKAPVFSVAFSPDGRSLASGGGFKPAPRGLFGVQWSNPTVDFSVRLWDLSGQHTMTILTGDCPIDSVIFSPYDNILTAPTWRGCYERYWQMDGYSRVTDSSGWMTPHVWNLGTGTKLSTPTFTSDYRYASTLSNDGRFMLIAVKDGVELRSVATGQSISKSLQGLSLLNAVIASSGQAVAQATSDYIQVWTYIDMNGEVAVYQKFTNKVSIVIFSPDSRLLAATDGHSVRLWDIVAVRELPASLYGLQMSSLAFTPDSKCLVAGTVNGSLNFVAVDTGTESRTVQGHKGQVFSLAFSPDGRFLASGGEDAKVKLWTVR